MADDLDDQLDYGFQSEPEVIGSHQSPEEIRPASKESLKRRSPPDASLGPKDAKKRKAEKDKARSRARTKEKKRIKNETDRTQKLELATWEPAMIADYVVSILKKADEKLSGLELQDRSVPENSIVNTSTEAVERFPENYPIFFDTFGLSDSFADKELVVVLCLSVDRINIVARMLSKCESHPVIKLTREQSPKLHAEILNTSRSHIAVSTPGRLDKLLRMGALDYSRIKRVVVDSTVLDAKQRSIWEFDETIPLVSELTRNHGTRIYLF